MKKSSLSIPTANKRLESLAKTFGMDSDIYETAESYIKERITDEKYLKIDDEGNIIGIKNSKAINTNTWGRSQKFNEYIPSTEDIIKDSLNFYKNDLENKEEPLTEEEKANMKYGPRTVKKNPELYNKLVLAAITRAADLNNYSGTRSDVYIVRDNNKSLPSDIYSEHKFYERAQALIDDGTKTQEWVHKARKLINEYDEIAESIDRTND